MKNLLFLAFTAFLFAGIFACTQSGNHSTAAQIAAKSSDSPVQPFMDPEKATAAMSRWNALRQVFVNALNGMNAPQDVRYVARGFQVPYSDLKGILENVGDTTKIFAMLAIQDSAGIPGKPMITLIFQAPDANRTLRYYDFTQPCPTDCPDLQ